MAHLRDLSGRMLGGLDTRRTHPAAPRWDAGEVVFGIECSYGTLSYSYSGDSDQNQRERSRRPACHNPVEEPGERHHCDLCGGDYCVVHAEPVQHDCRFIVASL